MRIVDYDILNCPRSFLERRDRNRMLLRELLEDVSHVKHNCNACLPLQQNLLFKYIYPFRKTFNVLKLLCWSTVGGCFGYLNKLTKAGVGRGTVHKRVLHRTWCQHEEASLQHSYGEGISFPLAGSQVVIGCYNLRRGCVDPPFIAFQLLSEDFTQRVTPW
ncbi:uncharacterized protein K444DRAFT_154871 [Hyaloscypha bicolor E]|uniref:Uncharacterized protein n=1 Tax=Hyaloscypha bicolor E TaxID=1095630 RepID=A0A2J6TS60_9HELO|nr:uncharacterized protein K444DRAFT_154871 [Hyaloscypha bicolor E]PMD65857.1 hypothetical protein K444DRAFT_154871 [Hyaloscypha bicolor E]